MTGDTFSATRTLSDQVKAALALCQDQVDGELAGFAKRLTEPHRQPEGCFQLLGAFPEAGSHVRRLQQLANAVQAAEPPVPPGTLERYLLLQAFRAALPRLHREPIDERSMRRVCAACLQVARPAAQWMAYFNHTTRAFHQMAKVASLRWYPANQVAFEFAGLPRSWLLKVHPRALQGLIGEVAWRLGGRGPLLTPHLWAWRANPYLVLKTEHERSLWLIAKTMEMRSEVKGLMSVSWYHSAAVGQAMPHLAWLHDFFVEQGAFLVEMEAAPPDAGFLAGSAKRRDLYRQGRFQPRQTLVLWRRAAMLAWADAHPELGEEPAARGRADAAGAAVRGPAAGAKAGTNPETAPAIVKKNYATIRAVDVINNNPKFYILSILVIPSILVGVATTMTNMWWAAVFTAPITFAIMWLFQYFLLQ